MLFDQLFDLCRALAGGTTPARWPLQKNRVFGKIHNLPLI
jgi:hypothetical protein